MNGKQLNIIIFFLAFSLKSYSQDFQITRPLLEFDGNELIISYDLICDNEADKFYVWVEIVKQNEALLKAKAFSGDVGDNIIGGLNKKIVWLPEKDTVFINEAIQVEVKAERRIKSFDNGSMLLLSALVPGYGQSKIQNDKRWLLAGVAFYGAMTTGLISRKSYLNTYNSYLLEGDIVARADLFADAQRQKNVSNTLLLTGLTIWITNICWLAFIPDEFKPLQHARLSLGQSLTPAKGATFLTFRIDF